MTNSQKRSARILMTNEARVLKDLRLQYRLYVANRYSSPLIGNHRSSFQIHESH